MLYKKVVGEIIKHSVVNCSCRFIDSKIYLKCFFFCGSSARKLLALQETTVCTSNICNYTHSLLWCTTGLQSGTTIV